MNTNNIGRVLVSLVVVCGFMTVTIMFLTAKASGAQPNDVLTILVGVLGTNFTQVISYWIGSSSGSTAKDEQQAKVAEKLAEKVQPSPAVVAWWSLLTDAERGAIIAATGDERVAAFVTTAKIGAASVDDLAYLVTKNLLTAERAGAIQKPGVA